MVDKRSAIGKMIDNKRVVYQCIKCSRQFIGSSETNITKCPFCKWTNQIVIVDSLLVTKAN
jgi:ribosomal protein L37AE/L43A